VEWGGFKNNFRLNLELTTLPRSVQKKGKKKRGKNGQNTAAILRPKTESLEESISRDGFFLPLRKKGKGKERDQYGIFLTMRNSGKANVQLILSNNGGRGLHIFLD